MRVVLATLLFAASFAQAQNTLDVVRPVAHECAALLSAASVAAKGSRKFSDSAEVVASGILASFQRVPSRYLHMAFLGLGRPEPTEIFVVEGHEAIAWVHRRARQNAASVWAWNQIEEHNDAVFQEERDEAGMFISRPDRWRRERAQTPDSVMLQAARLAGSYRHYPFLESKLPPAREFIIDLQRPLANEAYERYVAALAIPPPWMGEPLLLLIRWKFPSP